MIRCFDSPTNPYRPTAAGALALILSARKNDGLSVSQARALMMSTSVQAPSTYQGSSADTVTLQGAGENSIFETWLI